MSSIKLNTKPNDLLRPLWVQGLVIWTICTVLGLVDFSQSYFFNYSNYSEPQKAPWWSLLILGLSDWYVWALLTPLIAWMTKRYPLESATAIRLLMHSILSLLSALIVITATVIIVKQLPFPPKVTSRSFGEIFYIRVVQAFVFYVLVHWLILGVTHGVLYYNKFRERKLRASQLEAKLAQTELRMLKMQLHPHFLFNTLHAISALMHKDVNLAEKMIARLGTLLRATLEGTTAQEVALRRELQLLELYLEIEQARLGPRLSICVDVPAETLDAAVPNLLLQPLVENAVRHGIAPLTKSGEIRIRAYREDRSLHLSIEDTGPGLSTPLNYLKEGVGLSCTRARLRHLYGTAHDFELISRDSEGLTVHIRLPYREVRKETSPVDQGSSTLFALGETS